MLSLNIKQPELFDQDQKENQGMEIDRTFSEQQSSIFSQTQRFSKDFSKSSWIIFSDNKSDENMSEQQMLIMNEQKLKARIKSICMRQFIVGILVSRRSKDVQQSIIQFFTECKIFKLFFAWKKMTKEQKKIKMTSQCLSQILNFNKKRIFLKQLKVKLQQKEKKNIEFKRQMFNRLKIACSSQIQLRIKRIHLRQTINHRHLLVFTQNLAQQRMRYSQKMNKATRFERIQLKRRIFKLFVKNVQRQKALNLRQSEYELAYLINRRNILKHHFNSWVRTSFFN